jgi:hypothetical protein
LAPFDPPPVRIVFHPGLGTRLSDPSIWAFAEALAAHADLVLYEPRGHGASGGEFGPDVVADLERLLEAVGRWWRDGLGLIVAGHGLGGGLALAAAQLDQVRAVVALAPWLPPFEAAPGPFEALAGRVAGTPSWEQVTSLLDRLALPTDDWGPPKPTLVVRATDDPFDGGRARADGDGRGMTCSLTVPGGADAVIAAPWVDVVGVWAAGVAGRGFA